MYSRYSRIEQYLIWCAIIQHCNIVNIPKAIITPRCACAAKGLSDCSWTGLYSLYIYSVCKIFFQNSKNTHFQKSISTQEGFSSNSMASSTAYELGKSSWPSQILLVCRLGTESASSETQTLTRSKPHPYGIVLSSRYG